MDGSCKQIKDEQLEQWADDATLSAAERRAMANHIGHCVPCATRVTELRAYRTRMRSYQQTTTPETLPPGFLAHASAALDRVDTDRQPSPARPASPYLALRPMLAAACLLLLLTAVFAAIRSYRPREITLAELQQPLTGGLSMQTDDADQASQWLGAQLGTEVPTVNLALSGARLFSVRADAARGEGALLYHAADATLVTLRLTVNARPQVSDLQPVQYGGSRYYTQTGIENVVVWQADQRAFVAASPLPLSALLPLAHEMDLHCRKRP